MLADQTGRIREDRARVALTGKFHFQLLSLMRPPLILTASIPMKRKWHGETTGVCHHWPLYGVVILLFPMLSVCAGGCQRTPASPDLPTERPATKVNVLLLERVEGTRRVAEFFGTLTPSRQRSLGFGKAGILETIASVGSRVPAGELLCELDQADLKNRQAEILQSLKSLERQLGNFAAQQRASNENQLREVNAQIESGRQMAPYDCVVADVLVDQGSVVGPRTPVIRIVETSDPDVEINLPRSFADRMNVGDMVKATIDGENIDCEVQRKSIEEELPGSQLLWLRVTSSLDNIAWAFGQTVSVRFELMTDNAGYWVPSQALVREGNGIWSVFVVDKPSDRPTETEDLLSSRVSGKIVEIIQIAEDQVLIEGGFVDGELVIANGAHRVVPGQTVDPVVAEEPVGAVETAENNE